MKPSAKFKCKSCGKWHEGVRGWSYPFPMKYFDVPEAERATRCYLSEDLCVVDHSHFFVRGCLDIPILDHSERLVIGAWAEMDEQDFFEYQDLLDTPRRNTFGPYNGNLSAAIPTYEHTEGVALLVRVENDGIRP